MSCKTTKHDFTLLKEQNKLDLSKYSLSKRTINEWHKLSAYCVHASRLPSVIMFKNRVAGYTNRL